MEPTQTLLNAVSADLESSKALLAEARASIERCEAMQNIKASNLLNLPTKVGRAVEH